MVHQKDRLASACDRWNPSSTVTHTRNLALMFIPKAPPVNMAQKIIHRSIF